MVATIRDARIGDSPRVFELLRGKAEFDGAANSLSATVGDLSAILSDGDAHCGFVVAEIENEIVGFAAYYPIFSTFAAKPGLWMEDLFVDESRRGEGIGRKLLGVLAQKALEKGCCKLEWSLQTTNVRGIAFYEREGAVVREQNRFAKIDESAMRRLVSK